MPPTPARKPAITYLAGAAAPLAAVLAGILASGGLLTVALERWSSGSSDVQLAVNGILLIVAAIRFPSGVAGARSGRRSLEHTPASG